MHKILTVQVVNTKADVNEDFPNKILSQFLSSLLLLISREILILTVLHNNVQLRVVDVAVDIAHDEVRVHHL